ncbi:EamA-like transporter family [Phytophthora infestans]|uniref:EamA-like transporter family n=1 Tax=Phytophthora infestans TaxID=4787 RepID=A0A833T828_PHYIN|nr:EamA-like transporter family [Phytophthora infestans]KAF4133954.1 EamA-like transporter family [Phytophthora infestans]
MLLRSGAHGRAIVTPLPPQLKGNDASPAKKSPKKSATKEDCDTIRDDLPLLKSDSSREEISKTNESEIVTVVLPSTSRGSWGLEKVGGLGYIIVAALTFSIVSVCVKRASRYANSHIIVLWRMLIGLAMNCVWVHIKKTNLFVGRKDRFVLFLRCLVGTVGTTLSFYAMSNMPLTDAIVIIFTSPIFTFFLAAVVLGEAIDYVDLIGGVTSFIGVLFVTRPAILFPSQATGSSAPLLAIVCAMGSSLSQAIVYIAMRKMKDLDNLLVTHYFLMFGSFYAIFIVWVLGVKLELPTEPGFLFSIFGCAFFSLIGQWFLTKGFQTVKAGIASVMRYFDVVFVMCLDALVLGETVNLYSVIGAAVIISGASVIVMRQAVTKK